MKRQNILFLLLILVAVVFSTSFLFNQDLGEIEDIELIDNNSETTKIPFETPSKTITIPEDIAESNEVNDSKTNSSKYTYTIVDTGQEYCYDDKKQITAPQKGDPYYGQDAQCDGNQMAYQDNGDETISDLNTGLMWQKTPGEKLTYEEALGGAESFSLAGYDDWRLPTIKELYSLIDFSGSTGTDAKTSVPYINTDYFNFNYGDITIERFIDAQYCSSTLYVGTTMNGDKTVFGVNFADGRIKGYGITHRGGTVKTFYVMYVRGNPDYGVNNFTEIEEDIIIDEATGLMWTKFDSEKGMNWKEALEWVQLKNEMNFLGYSDWRLPNAKELQSIVNYTRSPSTTGSASIDPLFDVTQIVDEGGDVNYPFYWTGTTHLDGPDSGNAVYVAFGEALGYMEVPPGSSNYVLMDVHGAGAQRSSPKTGSADEFPIGRGPQGDVVRVENFVRLVRDYAEPIIN